MDLRFAHMHKQHSHSIIRSFESLSPVLFANALQENSELNMARVGIGLCRYALGTHQIAIKAFERALRIEPNEIGALVCLASINLNTPGHTAHCA